MLNICVSNISFEVISMYSIKVIFFYIYKISINGNQTLSGHISLLVLILIVLIQWPVLMSVLCLLVSSFYGIYLFTSFNLITL